MTLCELLSETEDLHQNMTIDITFVFGDDSRYWHLTDYLVSSAVSGPSIILIKKEPHHDN